ncbi:ribonuclease H-like domain-containing protein [Candidatus Woesearchaeota archaeon]|nr:ribonuclease H-like domain-containing protein [Candidatus Woesearchaeota archaeon]
MKLQFFPLDVTYKVENERTIVLLFGRTPEKKMLCMVDKQFLPYFYAIPKQGIDIGKWKKSVAGLSVQEGNALYRVEKVESTEKILGTENVPVVKISVNVPRAVKYFAKALQEQKEMQAIAEADIPFMKRYLIDKDIVPFTLHEVEGQPTKQRAKADSILSLASIRRIAEDTFQSSILAFDLETFNTGRVAKPEEHPIIMAGFASENIAKIVTWKMARLERGEVELVKSEVELLERMIKILERESPDILVGYFSDGFDFPYLRRRALKYRIPLNLGLDYSSIKYSRGSFPSAKIVGMNHVDLFKFLNNTMSNILETDRLDLNAVAKELLQEEKASFDLNTIAAVWQEGKPEQLAALARYNLQDATIIYRLATLLFPNIVELMKMVGLTAFDISRMGFSQLVEWYLIRQAVKENMLIPLKPTQERVLLRKEETYAGGLVVEPQPGVYQDLAVFDFRSLYPSLIASHNISPETLNCSCCAEKDNRVPLENEKLWFCEERRGFIPRIIADLVARRTRIQEIQQETDSKDRMLEARAYSLKILANAFYGYLGFAPARWYSLECAKATTAYGRHYIKKVIDAAQAAGFSVLYGDTDSIFFSLAGKSREEAMRFLEKINLELPEPMELELEGFYPRGIFVSAKLGMKGAKKKYALLEENGALKIRGFETVRSNYSAIAKEVQETVLEIILEEQDRAKAGQFVRSIIEELRQHRVPIPKLIITTQVQKPVEAYEQIPPHVAVAKQLMAKGIPVEVGMGIQYIIVKGKERIRDRARLPEDVSQEEYDAEYYIHNQIIPAVEAIFSVLDISTETLLEEGEQQKLDAFMKNG